ncbi:hypothetical protein QBC39DRAFT_135808 [Podospora conica]|nr:hypothetical protein QBC39DRAFT_135808 [Schizothecium conicum]
MLWCLLEVWKTLTVCSVILYLISSCQPYESHIVCLLMPHVPKEVLLLVGFKGCRAGPFRLMRPASLFESLAEPSCQSLRQPGVKCKPS